MAFQKIVLTISKRSAVEVKNILYKFNAKLPHITIIKRNSDSEIEIEFKVALEISEKVIKKFVRSGFSVEPIDTYTRKLLFQTEEELKDSLANSGVVSSPKTKVATEKSKSKKELINSVKKVLNGKKKITDANQKTLTEAFNFYLDKLRKDAFVSKSRAYDSIQELLEIAANKKLVSSPLVNVSKNAGLFAIDICANSDKDVGDLINICNNREINSLIRAKAAARFADIVFKDEAFYGEDISIAIRRLNTRWLSTLWDTSGHELSENEIENFNKLQLFIQDQSA